MGAPEHRHSEAGRLEAARLQSGRICNANWRMGRGSGCDQAFVRSPYAYRESSRQAHAHMIVLAVGHSSGGPTRITTKEGNGSNRSSRASRLAAKDLPCARGCRALSGWLPAARVVWASTRPIALRRDVALEGSELSRYLCRGRSAVGIA